MARTKVNELIPAINYIINGGFNFWQRGNDLTGITSTAKTYRADRFFTRLRNTGTYSVIRGSNPSGNGLPKNITESLRIRVDSGTGVSVDVGTALESETVKALRGKQLTLSWYGLMSADFAGTGDQLVASVYSGTGVDQDPAADYTGQVTLVSSTITNSTAWSRQQMTFVVPNDASELKIIWRSTYVGAAGANDSFYITGVMLNEGIFAQPFQLAGGDIEGELAKCQRYFKEFGPWSAYGAAFFAAAFDANTLRFYIPQSENMRSSTVAFTYKGTSTGYFQSMTGAVLDTIAADNTWSLTNGRATESASGLTTNALYYFSPGNSGRFWLDAEL